MLVCFARTGFGVLTRSFWELWNEFGIAEAISLLEIGERPHMKDGVCACLTMNMKLNYKTWIGMLLLAGTLFVSAPPAFSQVSIGIQIGAPPPPRAIAVRPPCPDPEDDEYVWVDGYWYPEEVIITGIEATGRVRRMLARSGSPHTMKRAATTVATGAVRTDASSTTITGIMTGSATAVAGTKTTASTKAGIKNITTTAIVTKELN